MKNINFEKTIIILIAFAGVLLSTLQFIDNRSLWLDEAYLALNIINKSHFELLKPLDYIQVAPILFLQVESRTTAYFRVMEIFPDFFEYRISIPAKNQL